jgi:hypothetical protein
MDENEKPFGIALRTRSNKPPTRLVLRTPKSRPKPKLTIETRNPSNRATHHVTISSAVPNKHTKAGFECQRRASCSVSPKIADMGMTCIRAEVQRPLGFMSSTDTKNQITEIHADRAVSSTRDNSGPENFESRIRSALRPRANNSNAPNIKHVKWDPAIVSISVSPRQLPLRKQVQNTPSFPKKENIGFDDCIKSIASLKKGDRGRLQSFLEALSKIEDGSNEDENVAIVESERKSACAKSLNPQAPVFTDLTSRKVKTYVPSGKLKLSKLSQTIIVESKSRSKTLELIDPPYEGSDIKKFYPSAPVLYLEDDYGRTAHAMNRDWANDLLERFLKRYPLTGTRYTPPIVTVVAPEGRYAAAIQQRLEFLILMEKEKKASAWKG